LIEKYSEIRDSNNQHLKRLKDFETERVKLFEKIKSLEYVVIESQIPLENSSNSDLSIDIVKSLSHATSDSRIMFVKRSMSNNQTHRKCRDKGKNIDVHDHEKFESKNLNLKILNLDLSLLVITVILSVIFDQTIFKFVLKNPGLENLCLGKMNMDLRIK
jgi:hypothetical protein